MASNHHAPDDADVGEEEAEVYVVEAIRDKRTNNGSTEYLIKWKGYPESECTWEPEANCACPKLIEAFERKQRSKVDKYNHAVKVRSLALERILGAVHGAADNDEMQLVVKWKTIDDPELMSIDAARHLFPQEVISFFIDNIKWL